MAEKKGVGHAYNVDFLNVVFAASSIFLFLSVIWMVWDDYDRDWKNTQRRFAELEYEVTQAQLKQASSAVDSTRLKELQAATKAIQDAEAKLAGKSNPQAAELIKQARALAFAPVVSSSLAGQKDFLKVFASNKKEVAISKQVTGLEESWNRKARENYAKATELAQQAAASIK